MPETIKTKIRGVSMKNENGRSRQDIIEEQISVDDDLSLIREINNRYDENAIAVYPGFHFDEEDTDDRIGYLSSELASKLAPLMDRGQHIDCTVMDITGDGSDTRGVNVLLKIYSEQETDALLRPSKANIQSTTKSVVNNKSSGKNFYVTLVLCIFVGWLGAHLFYANRSKLGLIYLFTGGCLAFGWIIDIFLLSFGKFKDGRGLYVLPE